VRVEGSVRVGEDPGEIPEGHIIQCSTITRGEYSSRFRKFPVRKERGFVLQFSLVN
jgi:hypothetical protein